ncbi:8-amino-7-oxononanoate synthase [Uliginosibacterium sp. 31-16]|uniref:8-amino-7-oxononanoate synthase n=1 Tax=Uliginosibacterium sp. 31-16 TaxID=3068315 RepID=UPI00273F0978|nr:8-amino-7-oxononanoate synthase [Uliginosibacterium sp. 31-16]MDP5239454.1 8-amino-7-oxononanoate synthase [Uliginosibacterium sp. 31-16]
MSRAPTAQLALQQQLADLDARDLLRRRRVQALPCSPATLNDGKPLLAFASNDYLGLANSPELIAAAQDAAMRWGVGSGASHLVSGHTEAHEALDQALADFVGCEAALSFSTGYLANLAVMPSLLGRGDAIFADRLNHASLIDGALLSRADLHRYAHLDMSMLASQLAASTAKRKLIVTDSVFSMDGDIAPLKQLLALAELHDAWLLVDDAHGFGVLGPQGRGALAEAELQSARLILMGTLGKAAGVAGAFVAGTRTVIDWLMQTARPYIFTTAAPPLLAATLLRALQLIEHGDRRREHLQSLIGALHTGLEGTRWQLLSSRTAIQPILIGDNMQALTVARQLEARGIQVPAIRPPSVPAGTARLRVSLSAAHSLDDVQALCTALRAIAPGQDAE